MLSAVAVTKEIDDMARAAKELIAQIEEQLSPYANKCGILYYDYEMEGVVLIDILQKYFAMDIIGCSCIAAIDGKQGFHDMCAVFTLLTANDCDFSMAATVPLDDGNARSAMVDAFNKAREPLGADPQLVFAFPPCGVDIALDKHLDIFSDSIGHIPIIGGIPSSVGASVKSVALNDTCYTDRLVLLLLRGNIRPVFALTNVVTTFSDKSGIVTKAQGNVLHEVGDGVTFVEFLESYGLDVHSVMQNGDRVFFQKYPLLITNPLHPAEHQVPYVRIIMGLEPEQGSGTGFASIPENARICLAVLTKEDIVASVDKGIQQLVQQIEENSRDGYRYSTVFCVSCAARHLVMTPHYSAEANRIKDLLPQELNLSGFYSYGELCPSAVIEGRAVNLLHNASLIFCAI